MNKVNAIKTDTFKIKGFVEIEIMNKKTHIARHKYYNTITNAGKQIILARSAASILKMGADTFGETFAYDTLTGETSQSTSYGANAKYSDYEHSICNVLVNLSDTLTANSNTINLWDSTLSNASKVIGYANANVVPTSNSKEGSISYSKGLYVVDSKTIAKRWKYPENVASGTFTHICMMSKDAINKPFAGGFKFKKCIDKCNTQYSNFSNLSTSFCPPGVPGFTSNDEILLNFTQDSNSRWKYTISTGEITAVDASANYWIIPYTREQIRDTYVDGTYLYVLVWPSATTNGTVYVYSIGANSITQVISITLSGNIQYNIDNAKFIYSNNTLYVGTCSSSTTSTPRKLYTLSKGANAYWSSVASYQTDYSSLGLNSMPSGWDIKNILVASYGQNYAIVSYNDGLYDGFVCTDLSNPFTTIIGYITMGRYDIPFSAGNNLGMISIGNCGKNNGNKYENYSDTNKIILDNQGTADTVDMSTSGIFIMMDGWFGNVLSFAELPTPIVKTDDDIMYVSYGYTIE